MADYVEGTTNWQDTLIKGAGAAANKAVIVSTVATALNLEHM